MVKQRPVCGEAHGVLSVGWNQRNGRRWHTSEGELLGVRNSTSTISPTSAREHNDLISSSTARVKVQAPIGKGTDNESLSSDVLVLARRDDIELLVLTSVTVFELNRDQVLPEIATIRINVKALSCGGLDLGGR